MRAVNQKWSGFQSRRKAGSLLVPYVAVMTTFELVFMVGEHLRWF